MAKINTSKIARLLASIPLATIAAESGVSLRTLQRLKASGLPGGFKNMEMLALWARGKR